jgi:hypothetical protein
MFENREILQAEWQSDAVQEKGILVLFKTK